MSYLCEFTPNRLLMQRQGTMMKGFTRCALLPLPSTECLNGHIHRGDWHGHIEKSEYVTKTVLKLYVDV